MNADAPVATATAVAPAAEVARATIANQSKSFALASKLLPARMRDQTAVVYTFCRRADDAVDETPSPATELARLRAELDTVYGTAPLGSVDRTTRTTPYLHQPAPRVTLDPVLGAFADIVKARHIPRAYPDALLDGMAMDVAGTQYRTLGELGVYCFRVASAVGLMMCHVFGLRDDDALVPAARLGLAMQLTNICRDVAEDWSRERLYLPDDLLADHGASGLAGDLRGAAPPATALPAIRETVRELLDIADDNYRAADRGMRDLPWRAALAVRAARRVYHAIGTVIRARDCDVMAGRAVTSKARKLVLVAAAGGATLAAWPTRVFARRPRIPTRTLSAHEVGLARLH